MPTFVLIAPIKMSKLTNYLKTIDPKQNNRKSKKIFFYVYRITNIITKQHYYGSRTCNILPEEDLGIKYTSSSKYVNADIAQYGMCNFKFKIIKKFNCVYDMILYESFLHNYHNVKANKKFLNKSNATPNSFSTSGLVVVYDKNDNIFTVDIDDEKYISGEYKILFGKTNAGKINVIDSNGSILKISLNDERITSGDVTLHTRIINKDKTTVFHIPSNKYIRINKQDIDREIHDFRHIKTKGMLVATDGKSKYYIRKTDERYLNGEIWSINKGMFTAKTKNGEFIRISEDDERFKSGELCGSNKNKVLVKDEDGAVFMISKDDERYINNKVQKIFGKYERTNWICPHCKKEGKGLTNANRWHFDNCKKLKY